MQHLKNMASGMVRSSPFVKSLLEIKFDNKALRDLPVDKSLIQESRQVPNSCYSLIKPTPVTNPTLVAKSPSALGLLGIGSETATENELLEYFSGNKILPNSETAAHCYCGHQFGYFSGQLGDGAAIYLGEVINNLNERWEIQLKGAGPTPYSRSSDGRKVLRSTIREFLCSEAMHHLGIPTTRAGTCITSDSKVIRDIFYDGHPKNERCTIVLRIAPTFLRFGSFEIFKPTDEVTGRSGPSPNNVDLLGTMLDYAVNTYFEDISNKYPDKIEKYTQMFKEVCITTARMVAKWQAFGFCHGVLNTDNMSIMGITIDYGPFGFMDRFDENFICNGSDDGGRYTYKKQPEICKWNLEKFAEAIKGVVPLEKTLPYLETYQEEYNKEYMSLMRKKLGLMKKDFPDDEKLFEELFSTMQETSADFTNTFRTLCDFPSNNSNNYEEDFSNILEKLVSNCSSLEELKLIYKPQMDPNQLRMILQLARENPGMLQALTGGRVGVIKREMDNIEKMSELQDKSSEEHIVGLKNSWTIWLAKYKKRLLLEADSENDLKEAIKNRRKVMRQHNPWFILRNYVAQNAIEEAEKGNFEEVRRVLKLLENPFEEPNIESGSNISDSSCSREIASEKPPTWSLSLKVT